MNFNELLYQYRYTFLIIMGVVVLLLVINSIVQGIRLRKLNKKYQKFIAGKDAKSLEETILSKFSQIDQISMTVDDLKVKMSEVSETLRSTYQKMGVVKYDAFKEMGGKLSFVMALLDDENSGVIINSMHSSREGCYTYAKEIIHGESFVALSEEEKEALQLALNKKNYMK